MEQRQDDKEQDSFAEDTEQEKGKLIEKELVPFEKEPSAAEEIPTPEKVSFSYVCLKLQGRPLMIRVPIIDVL